ncbi:SDR family oxidoreductase [Halobacillus salinarum]|uniref:SDR family oxidoreductase n=1 Tax=Halobacillus salinarum TaxID=2932257 RepID=A0ABY4EK57_9BACI|nr:SDR family oxidoreductase [Halobacillus salinarum]UOQ44859.1 SDR family oxidoreductase [Halobacillus salinarum]
MDNLFDLTGKTVIVTGGAGYLGAAMSEGLARHGADVMIVSRDKKKCRELAEQLNRKYNGNSKGYSIDVSDSQSIIATYEQIYNEHHQIDGLVNNAYYGAAGAVDTIKEEDWEKGIDGSIHNVFRNVKAVLPYMLQQKNGVLINISSMYGIVSPEPSVYGDSGFDNPANYGAGKAAIIQFTRYLACHYGSKGIRANCISPGPFPSDDVQQNTTFIGNLQKKTPLGRIGKPEELQGAVVFLASEASSYVTGHNLVVDGGWTAW